MVDGASMKTVSKFKILMSALCLSLLATPALTFVEVLMAVRCAVLVLEAPAILRAHFPGTFHKERKIRSLASIGKTQHPPEPLR